MSDIILNSTFPIYIFPLIILFPLFSSLISGFLGRKLGNTGVQIITCTSLIISSILIAFAFYEVGLNNNPQYLHLGSWVNSEYLNIKWELMFDQLSVSLGIAVIWCSTLIHIYSVDYLSSDPHIQRFFSYLSAFTASMLLLIFGGNYFVMFVGWEGIGVVSYLLINYYFTRVQANKAAILAFTMNRVGDMVMSIAFFALFFIFGTLNYSSIFSLVPNVNETTISVLGFLLLGGALAKSANVPLQSWLPGSMEAPTPVSALLHAATLVTAGVYLLLRSSPILEFAPTVLLAITLIGSTTALYGATCGLLQNDLKRIIAMSTISQLGYMFMAIGLSQYNVALFHTVNHAFFKALLFLAAGAVIHSFNDQQDVRKMGGLIKFLPFIYSVMLVGTISLMALPFLTGFYSKDLILELAYGKYSFSGIYAYILGTVTAGITAFYSFRLISLVFLQGANGQKQSYLNSHESNMAVIIPLLILSLFSIFFGYIMSDLFTGVGSDFFGNSLFIHPNNINIFEAENITSVSINNTDSVWVADGAWYQLLVVKLLPTIFSILGAGLGLLMYNNKNNFRFIINLVKLPHPFLLPASAKNSNLSALAKIDTNSELNTNTSESALAESYAVTSSNSSIGKRLYGFFNGKYYFDIVYNNFIISKGLHISYKISKEIDRGAIELLGPYGLSNLFSNAGKNLSKLDTGIITTYALYITLSLLVFIFFLCAAPYLVQILFINSTDVQANLGEGLPHYAAYAEIFKFLIVILSSWLALFISADSK